MAFPITAIHENNNLFQSFLDGPLSARHSLTRHAGAENWVVSQFVGMGPYQGILPTVRYTEDAFTMTGAGSAFYRMSFSARPYFHCVLHFEGTVTAEEGAQLLFARTDPRSYQPAYAYGLHIGRRGALSMVQWFHDGMHLYPLDLRLSMGQSIELLVKKNMLLLSLGERVYQYSLPEYPVAAEALYLSLLSDADNAALTVSGLTCPDDTAFSPVPPYTCHPVYLADAFPENDMLRFSWKYRSDDPYIGGVRIYYGGENHVVRFPANALLLPDNGADSFTILTLDANLEPVDGGRPVPIQRDKGPLHTSLPKITIQKRPDGAVFADANGPVRFCGANCIELRHGDHATFEPGFYNKYHTDTALRLLRDSGYNAVRIFISGGRCPENPGLGGDPLRNTPNFDALYMENVLDFFRRCLAYGLYVICNFCENELVNNQYYQSLGENTCRELILFNQGAITAKCTAVRRFLQYLVDDNPALANVLLGLQAQNEFQFVENLPPFNRIDGLYAFYDGSAWDLSDGASRRKLANHAMHLYYSRLREACHAVIPDLLLCEGTFTLAAVGKSMDSPRTAGMFPNGNDYRIPMTVPEYLACDIDFLDLHSYLSGNEDGEAAFRVDADSMFLDTPECRTLRKEKPVLLGEYGVYMRSPEVTGETVLRYLPALRDAALRDGLCGAFPWSFDGFSQNDVCHLMEDGGALLAALAFPTRY